MCGGGGSSGSAKFEPPSYTQPGWQAYLTQAQDLTQQAPTQYMGPRVAELSPQSYDAMDLITQTAMMGSPDVNTMRGTAMDIAGGRYLGSNPWLGQDYTGAVIGDTARNMAQAFGVGTAAQNDALAARQGAYGGSSWALKQANDAQGLASSVGQMANQFRLGQQQTGAQDYQQGLQQMLAASGMAPQAQAMDLQAGQALAGVGDMQRAYQQQLLDSLYNEFQAGQMAPFQNLDVMGNALARASGQYGTNTTYQSQGGFSPLAGLLGAAGIAYGLK